MMKLFPNSTHIFELTGDADQITPILKKNVEHSDHLISSYTSKLFTGTVDHKGFKVVSSAIRKGIFCVAKGKIEANTLKIELYIRPVYKIFIAIALLLPAISFIARSIIMGFDKTLPSIYFPILSALVIRFILIEFGFRYVSNDILRKITDLLDGLIKPKEL